MFSSRPDTSTKDFDFSSEVQWLSLKLSFECNAQLTPEQQSRFINVINSDQEVLLHNDKLVLHDCITYIIPTMMDVPVYLPYHTILYQLQGV